MKRTLTGIAAVALVMGALAPSAFADQNVAYSDVSGNFAAQNITSLSDQGYIHGYSDGTFRPNQIITRGQLLAYYLNVVKAATGVEPVAHKQYYQDIAPRNWDYNYVGAAAAAGWINQYWIGVKPGGYFQENYQASWGDAASFYVASMEAAGKLKPSDLGKKAPLAYAKSIGLFNGIPTSQKQMYLNRASAAVVLFNILAKVNGTAIPAGSMLTVSGNTTMAVNTSEQLTAVLKDPNGNVINTGNAQIQYTSSSPNAFVSPAGQLVITAPGSYQITATVDGVTSAPLTVTVAGAPAGVKITSSLPTLVANGTATDTITATVVDANGNPVTNLNGTMEFRDTNKQLVGANNTLTNDLTNVPVTNGVATIQVKSTSQLGATDTITGMNIAPSGGSVLMNGSSIVSGSVTLTQEQQVATSVKVTPVHNTVENNTPTEDGFTVQVLDQNGQPMLSGVTQVNLAISGPGKFDTATQTTTAYVGNGSVNSGILGNVWSEQGVSGPMVITASAPGLQSGSATIQSVVVGSPAAVHAVVDPSSSSTIVAGSSGGAFDLSTVDANGNLVSDLNNTGFTATVWQGATQVTSGVNVSISGNKAIVTGTTAGNYTLQVNSSDQLTPATIPFTIAAGSPLKAVITSPVTNVNLPIGNDTTTVTAQLQDAYGNTVSESGIPVQLVVATRSGADTASLGGSTSGTLTLTTNVSGQVTVPFTGSHTPGDAWSVGVNQISGNGVTMKPVMISMVGGVPTTMKVGVEDTASMAKNNPVYLYNTQEAQAGDTVTVTISPTDSYGNPSTNGDLIQVTLPTGLINPSSALTAVAGEPGVYTATLPRSGILTFTATAALQGSYKVMATDLSVGTQTLQGDAPITVVSGAAVGAGLFNAAGQEVSANNLMAVQANSPVELWIKPVDAQGNAVIQGSAAQTFNLSDGGKGGTFRSTEAGTNISSLQLPAGSSGIPVYYVNSTQGNYDLTAALPTSTSTN